MFTDRNGHIFGAILVCAWLSGFSHAETVVHQPSGIAFPDELEGFERTNTQDYESKQPGLGFSYTYKNKTDGVATVYVYTAGLAKVPANLADPVVSQLREHTIREITQFAERLGESITRHSLKTTLKVKTDKGEVPVFFDGFIISSPKRGSRNTFLWLWVSRGHFMKIRVTIPPAGSLDPKQMFAFSEAVVRLAAD